MNVNVKKCSTSYGNTAVGDCWNDVGIVRGFIKVPLNKVYDAGDIAELKTQLASDILADNPQLRIYPLQNIEVVTSATGTPPEQTFASTGRKIISSDAPYDFTYQWFDGGFCLHYAMRKSKGTTGAYIFIDSKGQLIAQSAEAGTDKIKGIVAYNWTNQFGWQIAPDAVSVYSTRLIFDAEQVNENIAILDFSDYGGISYLQSLNGLFNVKLSQVVDRAAAVIKVRANVGCSDTDMFDSYSDALSVATAWNAVKIANGAQVNIKSVAPDPTTKSWIVTLDDADPDYVATKGAILFSMAGPTELASLEVVGFESDKIPV